MNPWMDSFNRDTDVGASAVESRGATVGAGVVMVPF
jgi:hypothetical protein